LYKHQGVLVRLPRTREVETLLLRVGAQIANLTDTAAKLGHDSPSPSPPQPKLPSPLEHGAKPEPAMAASSPSPPPLVGIVSESAAEAVDTMLSREGPPEIPCSEIAFDRHRDLIGEGAFGSVYRATCRHKPVALKIWRRTAGWTEEQRAAVRAEVSIMMRIYSPNVVQFLGASTSLQGEIMIVSELMHTDLERVIYDQRREPLTQERKLRMLRDAALGCNWLHGICNIIHRDLKPANLLLDENERVKVADFGLSEFRKHGSLGQDDEDQTAKGTPLYSAPEVLLKKPFDNAIDVYAFGLIMYELMFETRFFTQFAQLEPYIDAVCHKHIRPPIPSMVV
jgi:hypothetical protein